MTLEEYVRAEQANYAEFAKVVRDILDAALRNQPDLPRPQQLQDRAKAAASLQKKLEKQGLLASNTIEAQVKDLAGCRIIFYTNGDVDRFLQSRIVFDNFLIEQDNTKVHYPVGENVPAERLYNAIHYIVALKPERIALPEYGRFAGMRCEIQIQTTLNHAWSETGHDILYKRPVSPGFGTKEMEAIERRFAKIMASYLLPAGHEFQKIKHDFDRLMEGKELFDRGVLDELARAADNNQRWDLLKQMREHVVPHYDDISAVFPELSRALVAAVHEGRKTPLKPIETAFGNFAGHSSRDVTEAAVDLIEYVRYVDVEATFASLCDIYPGGTDSKEKERISLAVARLAEHDVHVWRQVGPAVQSTLVGIVSRFDADQRRALRSLIASVCQHALEPDITGTSSSADTVTFHRGAVLASDLLRSIRSKALEVLDGLYSEAETEEEKRVTFQAMLTATRTPSAGTYSDDLYKIILDDSRKIVTFFTETSDGEQYELLQHIEHSFLWLYRHRSRPQDADSALLAPAIDALGASVLAYRDTINANADFVIYKTLVGFESVFPLHWENEQADYEVRDAYRAEQIERLVDGINEGNASHWLDIIERCAATRSEDMATFPPFCEFLKRLATVKPAMVLGYLDDTPEDLAPFLPPILEGLDQSAEQQETRERIRRWIGNGQFLRQIARRLRLAQQADAEDIQALAAKALAQEDVLAVIEVAVVVVARAELAGTALVDSVFVPATEFLTGRKDARWLGDAWFQRTGRAFFSRLTENQARITLANLIYWPKVEHQLQQVLGAIAEAHHDLVWSFFRDRLTHKADQKEERRYEAIPFDLRGPVQALRAHPNRAVSIVKGWHNPNDPAFRFQGGRLLAIAFPDMPDAFQTTLLALIASEGEQAFAFVAAILEEYHGEPFTYPLCQALIECLPENDRRLNHVEVVLLSTEMVRGEFGMVEAYQEKRAAIAPWLQDARPKIRAFAERYIRKLDNETAAEQRASEQRRELRRLDFESTDA